MYQHETKVRVRYGETDKMGYVYYGYYSLYYEVGRTEALRALGLSYKSLEDNGIMLPVSEMNVKYIRPAKYDDVLLVRTVVPELPSARITFLYEIFNESDELLNKASTSLVFVNMDNNRPCRPPQFFQDEIKAYFNS